jgi:tRNA (guanine6-N2)-methyltransferase
MATQPVWHIDVLPGLEEAARAEIAALAGPAAGASVRPHGEGALRARGIRQAALERARRVVAVYRVVHVDVPRPRGLLGHEHLTRLAGEARRATAGRDFHGVRIVAAGADSLVMIRLGRALAVELGLEHDQDDGDLVVRVVRDRARTGWEALVRTTPRPLATRPWRVGRFPGSLNATVAAHMVGMARARPGARAVNLLCGAGTLAIEHLLADPAATALGVDVDGSRALPVAAQNATAAQVAARLSLVRADAVALPLTGAARAPVLYADMPYGDKVRWSAPPDELYAGLLAEAARIAGPRASFVVVTEDIARFERAVGTSASWQAAERLRVFHGGHRPQIWRLVGP